MRLAARRLLSGVLLAGIICSPASALTQDINTNYAGKYAGGTMQSHRSSQKTRPAKGEQQTLEYKLLISFAAYIVLAGDGRGGEAPSAMKAAPAAKPGEIKNAMKAMNCAADIAVCVEPQGENAKKYSTIKRMFDIVAYAAGNRLSETMRDPLVQKMLTMALRNDEGSFEYSEEISSIYYGFLEFFENNAEDMRRAQQIMKNAAEEAKARARKTVPMPADMDAHAKETEIAKTPEYIRQIDLMDLVKKFERDPSDFGLQKIFLKLRYLQTKRSLLSSSIEAKDIQEREEISREISKLNEWLKEMGLWQEGESAERGLNRIQNAFASIQTMYYEIDNRHNFLLDYLRKTEGKSPKAFALFKGYLSSLDARAANLFEGILPSDRQYISKIKTRIDSFLASQDYKRAQGQWFEEYYKGFAPPEYGVGEQIQSQAHAGLAELPPLIAKSFAKYLEAIKSSGLGSEEERKLVVGTAIKLYAVSPLLVLKYFDAIANIAEICEDNETAFRDAMSALAARIATETDAITRASSPYNILPMNVRTISSRLASALEEISQINKAAVSRYDRLNLWDETVYMDPNPPHEIRQKGPAYIPNPALGLPQPGTLGTPYPFTNQYVPSISNIINTGSLGVNSVDYGGGLALPNIRPLNISGQATAQAMAMEAYIDPQHPFIAINEYLPGVNVSLLSSSKLLLEINKAFIPKEMPEYSREVIAGGAAGGVFGREYEEWQVGGAALGSFITPTGGFAFGGSVVEEQRLLAGSAALAVPLGHADDFSTVAGIDNAFAGYEQDLPTGAKELLAHAIATQWDEKNPSQHLITLNWKEDQDGKETMLERYFYIEKDGTVYELMGGKNDFVKTLNFGALYVNAPGGEDNKPATLAANVEPRIDTGGTAVAVDLGNTAVLGHIQQIPFWETAEETPGRQPMPRLLQWTGAFAINVEEGAEEGAAVHKVTMPGRILNLRREEEEGEVKDRYFLQDVIYNFRKVKGEKDAWEVTVGVGLGEAKVGETAEERPAKYMMGRGGFFIKAEDPKYSMGGGAYYESAGTRIEELAIMNEAEEARHYIENLHRVGMTIYGSRELADRLVIGALAQGIEQMREEQNMLGESTVEHDRLLGRFVGLLIGAKSAGRIDVSRLTGMETLLADYEQLGKQIAADSSQAGSLINQFREKYSDEVMRNFDRYSLGIQIRKDFSTEFFLLMREEENDFTSQTPANVYSRMLLTWGTEAGGEGFWRAFAAIPLRGQAEMVGNDVMGMMGTGFGQDLFNSVVLNRIAADFGLVAMRAPAEAGGNWREWDLKAGWFVQGAVRVFSNMLEDAREYKTLERNYNEYVGYVREGRYSQLPQEVRESIAGALQKEAAAVREEKVNRIRNGKDEYDENNMALLTPAELKRVEDALWAGWFAPKKEKIQNEFDGHYRQYVGGSVYFIGEDVHWDVGTIAEYLDGLASVRAYVIASQRAQLGIYGGIDIGYGGFKAGGLFGTTASGHGVAASVGYTWEGPLELPWNISLMGFSRSQNLPEYTIPLYRRYVDVSYPEFGAMVVLTIGAEGLPTLPMYANAPEPGLTGGGGP
ncbi:MAG: hypothetical protein QXH30_01150 [Candidatus Bilamarchaeaceae archaeon]